MPKIFFVIPAYNEEEGVASVLTEAGKIFKDLGLDHLFIVVNDGSSDRTQEVAEEFAKTLPVEIIKHPTNLNVGAVFRNGLTRAAELAEPGDMILQSEGDNTCSPEIYAKMIELMEKGNDFVAATRYSKGGQIEGFPLLRRIYSKGINTILRVFYPVKGVADYSIFIRLYRADLIQRSIAFYGDDWIESVGFVANAEMLIKARPLKPKCDEVPMFYRYSAKAGASKLNVQKTITEYFKFFSRLRKCNKKYANQTIPERKFNISA